MSEIEPTLDELKRSRLMGVMIRATALVQFERDGKIVDICVEGRHWIASRDLENELSTAIVLPFAACEAWRKVKEAGVEYAR